jgi:hypothetical protein
VVGKTQGEGKAVKKGERGWHLDDASANPIDLRAVPPFRKERERMGHPPASSRLLSFGKQVNVPSVPEFPRPRVSRAKPIAHTFVTPALCKEREGRGTHSIGDANEIRSLGHARVVRAG